MQREITENQKSRKFISGVYVLTLSTVIVKIIGLIYKIPMLKLLGNIGMGYFNSAYEIYAAFCVISTSGLPVAMSLMISSTEDGARRRKIFRVALLTFFLVGVVCMALILGLAYPFSRFLGSPETYFSLLCISPAIFFICLSGAGRGYFQGLGQMKQTAISQVIEAAGKLIFGLCFAYIGIRLGLEVKKIAGLAVLGLTLAEAISAAYLFLSKGREAGGVDTSGDGQIFKSLMKTTLPITLSSSVLSIAKLIDMTMIFRRLGSLGYGSDLINSIYGSYTTLAIPLFSLAPALVGAISLPLVPALSSARAQGDINSQNETARRAFKLTALLSAPVGAGLAIFSGPVLELIFSGETEAIAYASPLLSILGLSVVLSCLITVQNAILQVYEKPSLPLISMLCGSAAKIVLCYFLVGNPNINMYGIPIGTFACDFCISALNFCFLSRHTPLSFKLSDILIKPYFCAVGACVASYMISDIIRGRLDSAAAVTLCAVGLSAIIYCALLLITGALNKKEIGILLPQKQNT